MMQRTAVIQRACIALTLILGGAAALAAESAPVVEDSLVLPGLSSGKLLYAKVLPGSLEARSTYLPNLPETVLYEEGKDYQVDYEAGTMARTENSRIPDYQENNLYNQKNFNHSDFPGFGNNGFFVYLRYKTAAPYALCTPKNQADLLPKSLKKLREGGPFKLIAYGDSITCGIDATSPEVVFHQRWIKALKKNFPKAAITFENGATNGDNTVGGVNKLDDKVLSKKPDLVIIGFGMNDHNVHGVPPAAFQKNLIDIATRIRKETGAEVILYSTFPPNPEWIHSSHRMQDYAAATEAAATSLGCPYADVYAIWTKALERKDPSSLLGNNINHPNDFGHSLYLMAFEGLMLQ